MGLKTGSQSIFTGNVTWRCLRDIYAELHACISGIYTTYLELTQNTVQTCS